LAGNRSTFVRVAASEAAPHSLNGRPKSQA